MTLRTLCTIIESLLILAVATVQLGPYICCGLALCHLFGWCMVHDLNDSADRTLLFMLGCYIMIASLNILLAQPALPNQGPGQALFALPALGCGYMAAAVAVGRHFSLGR